MFFKLLFKESDKRKKIDDLTSTFNGLLDYTRRIFKIDDKNVGFLFMGQDDASTYEITCDEDLEYVLETSKAFAYRSKFVVIKVIENIETSPENPNGFQLTGGSDEILSNLSNETPIAKEQAVKEVKEVMQEEIKQVEVALEQNLSKMNIEEYKVIEEDKIETLNDELKLINLEEEVPVQNNVEKIKTILDSKVIGDIALKISESFEQEDFKNQIGNILNETLSKITKEFIDEKKDKKAKKQNKKLKKIRKFKNKIKRKIAKTNHKLEQMYDDLDETTLSKVCQNYVKMGKNKKFNENTREMQNTIEQMQLRINEVEAMNASLLNRKLVEMPKNEAKMTVETKHMGITCDNCNKHNFSGRRFKCMICDDFDLCETCEGHTVHAHPMIRMTSNSYKTHQLNNGLRFLRNRPKFRNIFNMSSEQETVTSMHPGKFGPWGGFFRGMGGRGNGHGKFWKKYCKKRSSRVLSSSSSSDSSQSPDKDHDMTNDQNKCKGPWGKKRGGSGRFHKRGPHGGKHHPYSKWMRKDKCPMMFNSMGPQFGKCRRNKNPVNKQAEAIYVPANQEDLKNIQTKVDSHMKNKNPKDVIPKKMMEELERMGVEVVDCFVQPKDGPVPVINLGPNDFKIEVNLDATEANVVETKESVEVPDLMKEDPIIRSSYVSVISKDKSVVVTEPEDFSIVSENPENKGQKIAMSEEEIIIEERKQFTRSALSPHTINEEILEFFVRSNSDLSMEKFSQFINDQKRFLIN